MYCRHCGSKVGDNDMVCANCGALTEYGERVANHDAIPPENNANAINPDGSLNKDAYRPGGTAGQNGGAQVIKTGIIITLPKTRGIVPVKIKRAIPWLWRDLSVLFSSRSWGLF